MKSDDAPITQVCWWGTFFDPSHEADAFEVTYFDDAGGWPGAVVAGPFVQGDTLTVGEAVPTGAGLHTAYTATHPPVTRAAGICTWMRIRHVSACVLPRFRWAWSLDGDGHAVLDDAFTSPGFGLEDVVTGHDYAWCIDAPFETVACPFCAADVDGDGEVGVEDLVAVIVAWGPCPGCPEDVDGDGGVDVDDLVAVVAGWGCGA